MDNHADIPRIEDFDSNTLVTGDDPVMIATNDGEKTLFVARRDDDVTPTGYPVVIVSVADEDRPKELTSRTGESVPTKGALVFNGSPSGIESAAKHLFEGVPEVDTELARAETRGRKYAEVLYADTTGGFKIESLTNGQSRGQSSHMDRDSAEIEFEKKIHLSSRFDGINMKRLPSHVQGSDQAPKQGRRTNTPSM